MIYNNTDGKIKRCNSGGDYFECDETWEIFHIFFLVIFKTIKITANNLMLFQCFFTFKTTQILSFFIAKYYSSSKIT